MARALVKLARVDEAVGVAEEALRIAELHEDNASRTANARLALAEALWERGDQERARTAARAAQRYAHAELTECDPLRVEVDAWIKAREGAAPAG